MIVKRLTQLALTIAALALCGAILGSCGDEDQGGDAKAPAASNVSDETEVRKAFRSFEVAFQSGDGYRACRMLTDAARADASDLLSTDKTCQETISQLGDTAGDVKQRPSKILSIEVDGDTATASVSDAGRPPVSLPFTKEGGEWKVADIGFGQGS